MAEIEKLIADLERRAEVHAELAKQGKKAEPWPELLAEAATALRAMQAEKRELALDVLASSGQAQEAYEAQLAAEARLADVEKERDARIEPEIVDQMLNTAQPIMAEALTAETERADAAEAKVAELEAKLGGALLGQWIDAGMPNDEASTLRAALTVVRMSRGWHDLSAETQAMIDGVLEGGV